MTSRPRSDTARTLAALALALVAAAGCALGAHTQKLANGDLEVACNGPLIPCLKPVTDTCTEYGYDIVRAEERHETTGSPPEQQTFVRSEATVRCRHAKPLFGHDPEVPAASAAPAPAAGPPRCVPGASQACATPTCSGAQVCVADGTRFGPCECAPPAAPSAANSAAPRDTM
ncbi:MAG TPA: hypothetical protein VMI54_07235 [Polyangiaceae bacterium]|nr:hypothetical protein [Polyangiaceae bacterium]